MKKILYILQHDPWGVGGGSYISRLYLTAFLHVFQSYQFDVLIADHCLSKLPEDYNSNCNFIPVSKRNNLVRVCSVVTGVMHRYQSKGKELLRSNDYDYCIFDHSQIAGSLLPFVGGTTKTIVLHHNYEAKYFKDNTISFMKRICFSHFVSQAEKTAFLNSTYNIFLTKEDMLQFRENYGKEKGDSIIGGIFDFADTKECLEKVPHEKLTCVITGSLDNVQNTDGLLYFFNDLYPLLSKEVDIVIAGKNPTNEILDIVKGKDNVRLIPSPKNMNDVIRLGDIYMCPTRLGSGIKVRITDGLRNGLPVIAHAISARGYSDFEERGYMVKFKTPEEFILGFRKLSHLLKEKSNTHYDIRGYYASTHSFSGGVKRLKEMIDSKL